MFVRRSVLGLLPLCLGSFGFIGSTLIGCSNNGLDSVQVTPASQALVVGQTAQFTAIGTFGNAKKPTTQNITTSVTWTSSVPSVATISAAGLATAVGAGTTTITASTSSYNGHVTSSATLTVTGSSGGGTSGGAVASLSIIPASQAVASPTQTSQFIAIGTTSSGATVNLSNQVAWSSSSPQIATINASTGLATGVGKGSSTITAIYNNTSGGTVVTGTASFTVLGGTTQQFTALTILPSSQALSTLGQTAQFIALATSGTTGLQQDVTGSTQLKWNSSAPTAGSISSTGLAKNLAAGVSSITAVLTNSDGSVVSNTATLTTTLTAAPQDLLSLTIIPSSIGLANLQGTGQFLAIGTYATPPYVRDVTNSAQTQWISSAPNVFPVTTNNSAAPTSGSQNAGVASAFGIGSGVIVAEVKGSDGTIQTATATFSCPFVIASPGTPPSAANPNGTPPTPGSCGPNSQASALLSTLTVYNEGLNTNTVQNWQVTAPSASNPPSPYVLHCGPGWKNTTGDPTLDGPVCTATYPVGSTVTLTVPASDPVTGAKFGGWSSTCLQTVPAVPSEHGQNQCTVLLTSDDTVGVIFN